MVIRRQRRKAFAEVGAGGCVWRLGDGHDGGEVMTSIVLIIGGLVMLWRRSSDRSQKVKQLVVPKSVVIKEEQDEFEVGSGRTRVFISYGTQTGTTEGFTKGTDRGVWWEQLRYGIFGLENQ